LTVVASFSYNWIKVDLALYGHEHYAELTCPIKADGTCAGKKNMPPIKADGTCTGKKNVPIL
jgi:hypothetical protein